MRNDRWSTAEEIKRILVPADQNSGESGATLYYEKKKNYVQISKGTHYSWVSQEQVNPAPGRFC